MADEAKRSWTEIIQQRSSRHHCNIPITSRTVITILCGLSRGTGLNSFDVYGSVPALKVTPNRGRSGAKTLRGNNESCLLGIPIG